MQHTLSKEVILAAGYSTWVVFAICMRCYFRGARRATAAKTWLTRAAVACTLTQMAALALARPSDLALPWAGLAAYATANALFWWALATHGRERPAFALLPVTPARLRTSGPYRLVRHPIYTAYLLAWLAGPVATGQLWLLATAAGMGVLYYRTARLEELHLLSGPLASAYQAYRSRTGMFVPRVGW